MVNIQCERDDLAFFTAGDGWQFAAARAIRKSREVVSVNGSRVAVVQIAATNLRKLMLGEKKEPNAWSQRWSNNVGFAVNLGSIASVLLSCSYSTNPKRHCPATRSSWP
jgi:hypothetical protein